MAEGPINPGDRLRLSPSFEETRMEEPVVSREPAQADVVVQPNTTCAQCKKEVKSPHLLYCLHSVCLECLPGMAVEGQRIKCGECGDTSTYCSSSQGVENQCRADIVHCVPIPNGPLSRYMEGVKIIGKICNQPSIPCGIKKCKTSNSPSTVYCTDCVIFMCEICSSGHEVFPQFEHHTVKNVEEMGGLSPADCQQMLSKSPTANTCPLHRGKVLEYCCERCSLLMCHTCAIGNANPHKLKHIPANPTVAEPHRQALMAAHQAIVCFGKKCEAVEEQLQTELRTVEQTTEASLGGLNAAFQSIYEAVERRREELHRQIINAAEEKKRAIRSKLKSVKSEKKTVSHVESTLELLKSSNTNDLIASKDLIQTHQSFLKLKWCGHNLENTLSSVLSFEAPTQEAVLKALKEFGIVTDGACPEKCTVEPKPEQLQSTAANPVPLKVMAFDSKGIACTRGGDKIEAFLRPKPPTPGPAIKARVVDNDNGTYSVSIPSVYPGPCLLSIKVNKRDIRGSPFVVTLQRHARCIKGPKRYLRVPQGSGKLCGITVSQKGSIYVSDTCNDVIHVFDKERNYIKSFRTKGREEGQLHGLAVGSDGLLYATSYATSYGNSRIDVFKEDGSFVRQIGDCQSDVLYFDDLDNLLKHPVSVAIHNRHLFIADYGKHRVSVYTLEGEHVLNFGKVGKEPGQFINPRAVAFSQDGDMYVTDQGNHRVQVFDANGQYKRGFGLGQLKKPHGIVITSDGDVLVADQGKKRIAVFSTRGNTNKLVHSFRVECPCDLAIDNEGNILVTDYLNKQVVVF